MFEDEINFFLKQEVRSINTYGKILNAFASGATKLNQVDSKAQIGSSGTTSKYLDVLSTMGIVEKEIPFGESTHSKRTSYRIKDQFFRFHYTFLEDKLSSKVIMTPTLFYETHIEKLLDKYVSFEFETICQQFLIQKYQTSIQEIGRYWFNDSKKKLDVEIDILMKNNNKITAFECKWTNKKIDIKVVSDLEEKIENINIDSLGFFSKSGFDISSDYECYTLEDLYNSSYY